MDLSLAPARRGRDRRVGLASSDADAPPRRGPSRLPAEPGRRAGLGPGASVDPAPRRPDRHRWPPDRLRLPSLRLPAAGDRARGTGARARDAASVSVACNRPVEPRPAATVVLLRDGPDGLETLLTRRPTTMAFAADVHVFPGGRVDAADADPRSPRRSVRSPEAAPRRSAATSTRSAHWPPTWPRSASSSRRPASCSPTRRGHEDADHGGPECARPRRDDVP